MTEDDRAYVLSILRAKWRSLRDLGPATDDEAGASRKRRAIEKAVEAIELAKTRPEPTSGQGGPT